MIMVGQASKVFKVEIERALNLRYEVLIDPSRAVRQYCNREQSDSSPSNSSSWDTPPSLSFRQSFKCQQGFYWRKDLSRWEDVCTSYGEEHTYQHRVARFFKIKMQCGITFMGFAASMKGLEFNLFR